MADILMGIWERKICVSSIFWGLNFDGYLVSYEMSIFTCGELKGIEEEAVITYFGEWTQDSTGITEDNCDEPCIIWGAV
jgi:hypothetical protein